MYTNSDPRQTLIPHNDNFRADCNGLVYHQSLHVVHQVSELIHLDKTLKNRASRMYVRLKKQVAVIEIVV